jgi:hypothetical protein
VSGCPVGHRTPDRGKVRAMQFTGPPHAFHAWMFDQLFAVDALTDRDYTLGNSCLALSGPRRYDPDPRVYDMLAPYLVPTDTWHVLPGMEVVNSHLRERHLSTAVNPPIKRGDMVLAMLKTGHRMRLITSRLQRGRHAIEFQCKCLLENWDGPVRCSQPTVAVKDWVRVLTDDRPPAIVAMRLLGHLATSRNQPTPIANGVKQAWEQAGRGDRGPLVKSLSRLPVAYLNSKKGNAQVVTVLMLLKGGVVRTGLMHALAKRILDPICHIEDTDMSLRWDIAVHAPHWLLQYPGGGPHAATRNYGWLLLHARVRARCARQVVDPERDLGAYESVPLEVVELIHDRVVPADKRGRAGYSALDWKQRVR